MRCKLSCVEFHTTYSISCWGIRSARLGGAATDPGLLSDLELVGRVGGLFLTPGGARQEACSILAVGLMSLGRLSR